jgi:Uma2 family endonuclease
MAGPTHARAALTLDEFLALPEEKPPLEYIDGRIEAKVSPKANHSLLTVRLVRALNECAEPTGLGLALVALRCVFDERAIVPDVVFLVAEHIPTDECGWVRDDELERAPDLHVEIVSPRQSSQRSVDKLLHSTAHGCSLGWLIDPNKETVDVYRPGQPPERLASDGQLDGAPVLPDFRIRVADVFGWLQVRTHRPKPGSEPGAGPG